MNADDVTGSSPDTRPIGGASGVTTRVVVGLVEVDQREQVFFGSMRLRRQDPMPPRRPAPPAPVFEKVADVHGQRVRVVWRVGPAVGVGVHLEAAGARLAVEDRHSAEVGVWADAELSGFGLADHAHRRVVVDVHRPSGSVGQ